MNIGNLSLAEIVTAKPEAATIFDNLQLDFCCRGKQKLNDVLSNDQAKLASVVEKLQELFIEEKSTDLNFNTMSLTELIDHIVNHHHQYVKESMPVIQQHLKKVVTKHGDNFPYMKNVLEIFEEIGMDLSHHLMKEELILFPKIRRILSKEDNTSSIRTIIRVMEIEHQDAGQLMNDIRKLTNNYTAPENACITFRISLDELRLFEEDLHRHVHLENNILFPKAIEMQGEGNLSSRDQNIR